MILARLSCISRNQLLSNFSYIWTFLFGFPIFFFWGGGRNSNPPRFCWNKRPWRVAACRNVWRIYASWVFVDLSHERPAGLDQCTVAFQRWRDQCTAKWKIPTIWRCKFPIKKLWFSNVFQCIVCLLEGNVFFLIKWLGGLIFGELWWTNMTKLMRWFCKRDPPIEGAVVFLRISQCEIVTYIIYFNMIYNILSLFYYIYLYR